MERPDGLSEDELLAHLRGDADPEVSAQIDARAKTDPALRAELALMAGLRGALEHDDDAAAGDGDGAGKAGWERLATEINRTTPANLPHRPIWRIAAMLLGAVVLVQGIFIVTGGSVDAPLYRTVTEAPAEATLAVAFGSQTTASEIETLLRQNGARIVDGPSALGLYRLVFADAAARDAARTALETSTLVDMVAEE